MNSNTPQPANTSEELRKQIIGELDNFYNNERTYDESADVIMQLIADHDAKLITTYIDKFSTNGRPLSAPPLIKKMPVPCSDCGAEEYADWFIYPHQVYNAVFPGGVGHTCLPCFSKRVIALRSVFNMKEEADGDTN